MKTRLKLYILMAACILTISCHEEESLLPIEFEWSVVNPTDMTVISDYAPINYTVPAEGSKIWLQQFRGPKSDLRWNFSINDKTIDSEIGPVSYTDLTLPTNREVEAL